MSNVLIKAKEVWKTYKVGEVFVNALRGVNLSIKEGEFVFIVGPSGSGKTTLLDVLGGLSRPTKGKVFVRGNDLYSFDDYELSFYRRYKVGFVFQAFNLAPSLTAFENVLLPKMPDGISKQDKEKAEELLKVLGLGKRKNHKPTQLSGGEKQRVAIARALINNPLIIFADEPTGELDSKTGEEVIEYMRKINKEEKKTFVIVTHDLEYIKKRDKVFKLKDGRIVK